MEVILVICIGFLSAINIASQFVMSDKYDKLNEENKRLREENKMLESFNSMSESQLTAKTLENFKLKNELEEAKKKTKK